MPPGLGGGHHHGGFGGRGFGGRGFGGGGPRGFGGFGGPRPGFGPRPFGRPFGPRPIPRPIGVPVPLIVPVPVGGAYPQQYDYGNQGVYPVQEIKYVVIYQVKSPYQTIKIVEFTSQERDKSEIIALQSSQLNNNNNNLNNVNNVNNASNIIPSAPVDDGNDLRGPLLSFSAQKEGEGEGKEGEINDNNIEPPLSTDDNPLSNNNNVNNAILSQITPAVSVVQQSKYHRGLILENEIQFSTKDEIDYHNGLVHTPMNISLSKGLSNLNILIIGGGDGGVLRELVKYNNAIINSITMIEIDQMVINTCKQHFPSMTVGFNDQRVNLIISDALGWVQSQSNPNSIYNNYFDLIIVDLTEDGSLSSPLRGDSFWNSLSIVFKKNSQNSMMVRNGYHLPNFIDTNICNNKMYYTTNLPSFGGNYIFTLLSNSAIFTNINDYGRVNQTIDGRFNRVKTTINLATSEELTNAINYANYQTQTQTQPQSYQSGGYGYQAAPVIATQNNNRRVCCFVVFFLVCVILIVAFLQT